MFKTKLEATSEQQRSKAACPHSAMNSAVLIQSNANVVTVPCVAARLDELEKMDELAG